MPLARSRVTEVTSTPPIQMSLRVVAFFGLGQGHASMFLGHELGRVGSHLGLNVEMDSWCSSGCPTSWRVHDYPYLKGQGTRNWVTTMAKTHLGDLQPWQADLLSTLPRYVETSRSHLFGLVNQKRAGPVFSEPASAFSGSRPASSCAPTCGSTFHVR